MRIAILALGLTASLGVTSAGAQTAPPALPTQPSASTTQSVVEGATTPEREVRAPITLDELAGLNGKQGDKVSIALTEQDLNAVNHGNTITANTVGSGQISIGSGAYQGFAGVGNFVINSGHNNNLQGALTINVVSP